MIFGLIARCMEITIAKGFAKTVQSATLFSDFRNIYSTLKGRRMLAVSMSRLSLSRRRNCT